MDFARKYVSAVKTLSAKCTPRFYERRREITRIVLARKSASAVKTRNDRDTCRVNEN